MPQFHLRRLGHAVALALGILAAGSGAASAAEGRMSEETFSIGGQPRRAVIHDYSSGKATAPVVILLHGGGGNPENAITMTRFDALAGFQAGDTRLGSGHLSGVRVSVGGRRA